MAPVLVRIYEQMLEPKFVLSRGACASSGGFYRAYHVLQGADKVIPVDVYVPGCPPAPEGLLNALLRLEDRIAKGDTYSQRRERSLKKINNATIGAGDVK